MGRLLGFDYKRPFFYMVTVKGARSAPGKTGFAAAAPQPLPPGRRPAP